MGSQGWLWDVWGDAQGDPREIVGVQGQEQGQGKGIGTMVSTPALRAVALTEAPYSAESAMIGRLYFTFSRSILVAWGEMGMEWANP